ncbi:helix-turn-helix transcriptional regulator (plasmid) [Brevibacterium sp. JNUCC-42]|nr:helix-turn-helix transcriptional regulator [Brevibacterium sp. JNUCC-42]
MKIAIILLKKGDCLVFEIKKSIRAEIESCMQAKNCTMTKLSELSGIKVGHISEILNRRRAITIKQLDSFSEAFNCESGWMYDLYVDECISEKKMSKPRLVPYLIRCAEIGRYDCIELAVSRLLEVPKNIVVIFLVAEQLFEKNLLKESVFFYEIVVSNIKNSYADISVMSRYRIFRASQLQNSSDIWEDVIQFYPYRNRLPENNQLDALLHLANVCFMLEKWKYIEQCADELRELATLVYKNQLVKLEPLETERHLVVYYGQGFLAKSVALQMQGLYEEAKTYVKGYSDLSWFQYLDDNGKKEVEKFHMWSKANFYVFELLTGNKNVLADYVDFLENHSSEISAGLLTIMESAIKYDFSIDHILEKLSIHISCFNDYTDSVNIGRHYHFRYCKTIYDLKKGCIESALEEILYCIHLADKLNHQRKFKQCVWLFWKYRVHASEDQRKVFQNILEGDKKDEKCIYVLSGNM